MDPALSREHAHWSSARDGRRWNLKIPKCNNMLILRKTCTDLPSDKGSTTLLQQQRERLFFKHRGQGTANIPDCQFLSNPPFECETKTSFVHPKRILFFYMEAELLLCSLDVPSTRGQTKHPPGGKAVAATWLPVSAEDLTRRELLIPF